MCAELSCTLSTNMMPELVKSEEFYLVLLMIFCVIATDKNFKSWHAFFFFLHSLPRLVSDQPNRPLFPFIRS